MSFKTPQFQEIDECDAPERRLFLWGVPRSVSSAVERSFQQRADTEVVSEPLIDLYYCSNERCSNRFLPDDPGNIRYGYRSILRKLLERKGKPLMFSKNMAFYLNRRNPRPLLERGTNSFIIRDPEKALRSHYKIDPEFNAEEAGYLALRRMFHIVTEEFHQKPIVLDGSSVRKNPETTLKSYCETLGIPFDPQMLNWKAESAFDPQYKIWTEDIDNSNRFIPEDDRNKEITLPDRVRRIIDECRPHYEYLSQFALTPTSPPPNSPDTSSVPG